jgi:transposase
MIATMTIEEPTDADIFLAYLDHVLCSKLRPGDVVVMDNLSAHKVNGVRERIATAGAELLYLPPYSPDLNPHRKGLVEAQNTAAFGQGPHSRNTR